MEATATDNAGVVALTYTLNGGESRALEVPTASDGAFSFDVTPRPGKNHVVLRARDALGNEGERAVDFHFGNIATAGGLHSGTLREGRVYVWGRNLSGQLGLGPGVPTGQKTPQPVPGLEDMAAIAFNQSFSMALGSDGSVWTWGANDEGQLGLGTPPVEGEPHTPDVAQRDSAERIQGITGAVAVAPGFEHALVLMEDGTVRAFGNNEAGQLGDGTFESRDYPVTVAGLTGVVKVMAGSAHSLALRGDGTVWAWGRNTYGNLGTGTTSTTGRPTAAEVPGLKDVVDIANGRDHVLAVHSDGTVSSWGLGVSGQLGRGTTTTSATPEKVPGITQARAAFANGNYGFIRLVDGSLMSWGQNGNGQLGDGSQTQRTQPVVAGSAVKPLAGMGMGATHVIAVRADGTVYAWGWNLEGSLGPDAVIDRWSYTDPIPVPVP
ncbi:chromosome condensation regulator RCC1 [Myxococcus stipitatus]|nr:chromosome condensation regulator RCC1 [Myxococcus stipitatus]